MLAFPYPQGRSLHRRRRRFRVLCWLLGISAVACLPRRVEPTPEVPKSKLLDPGPGSTQLNSEAPLGPHLIPPLQGNEVATLGSDPDGTRRIIAYGLRVLARPDGSVETAQQFFPLARNIQAIELPERLGGGFAFWVHRSGRTPVWTAKSWTARLQPFAELDFEVDRLVPGFDRIYVQARRTADWAALEPSSGKGSSLGSLPASPSYGAMAFVDEWFGAVDLPLRGTVVSFDAGRRWHPLGMVALALKPEANELVILTPAGRRALGSDGSLHSRESTPRRSAHARRIRPESPVGPFPLKTAVLRGFSGPPGTAITLAQGTLAKVRLSDGLVLKTREKVASPSGSCQGVRLGKGHGFVCGDPAGGMQVFAFRPDFTLELVEAFATPRVIRQSGNGALVVGGGCGSLAADTPKAINCIRTPQGKQWELRARAPDATERVIALSDGRAAVISPPGPKRPGTLTVLDARQTAETLPIIFPKNANRSDQGLLERGFWLDGWVQASDGSLQGWVTWRSGFAGVHLGLDGRARVGPVKRSIERALIAGGHGLIVPAAGMAEQTIDGGLSWSDVELPLEIEPDPARATSGDQGLEQGCSTLGCAFLGWLRVGWNGSAGSTSLPVAPDPASTVLPSPGGGRWRIRCTATNEVSPPPARLRATELDASESDEPRHHWMPLIEREPPRLPPGALGVDTGNEGQLRAYAWVPHASDFGSSRFQVSVVDRFRARGGVWTTLATRSPWNDRAQMTEAFGYEGSTPSVWNLALDSSGRAGVLAIAARGSTELYAIEEGRAPQWLASPSRQGIGAIMSVVRLGSTYYVAAQEEGRTFRVFALEAGKARLIGHYPDAALGRTIQPVLVKDTRNEALGIWGRGAGWYVFPLDNRSGTIGDPIVIAARQLSSMPASCAVDEEGYLLEGTLGIDPYAELASSGEVLGARGFEGRFVVQEGRLCLRELSARAEGLSELAASQKQPRPAAPSVPLVLTDRAAGGRRWAFRCSAERG